MKSKNVFKNVKTVKDRKKVKIFFGIPILNPSKKGPWLFENKVLGGNVSYWSSGVGAKNTQD